MIQRTGEKKEPLTATKSFVLTSLQAGGLSQKQVEKMMRANQEFKDAAKNGQPIATYEFSGIRNPEGYQ